MTNRYPRWVSTPQFSFDEAGLRAVFNEAGLREVFPGLYVGGEHSVNSGAWHKVVVLYAYTNTHAISQDRLIRVPFIDGDSFPPGLIDRVWREWQELRSRPEGPKMLISCQAGASRSASLAAALMVAQGLTEKEAVRRVRIAPDVTVFPRARTLESALNWAREQKKK